jgi:hypothetical protein
MWPLNDNISQKTFVDCITNKSFSGGIRSKEKENVEGVGQNYDNY